HLTKWQRGFKRVVDVQGTDHHSTVTRVRVGLQALNAGVPKGWPDYVLHSIVKVMRGGEEVKMSKRAGSYVTVRDLIDWVGRDAGLARMLDEFPETVAKAALEAAPHDIAFYLRELAAQFHSYYNAERILVDDEDLRTARLALCAAVRQTLANGLSLIGVSAPEKMRWRQPKPRTERAGPRRPGSPSAASAVCCSAS